MLPPFLQFPHNEPEQMVTPDTGEMGGTKEIELLDKIVGDTSEVMIKIHLPFQVCHRNNVSLVVAL